MCDSIPIIGNFVGGAYVTADSGQQHLLDVLNPADQSIIGRVVADTDPADIEAAIDAAAVAFESWRKQTVQARAAILLRFHALVQDHLAELTDLIVQENGKNYTEAAADIAKGNETLLYACSLVTSAVGHIQQVSGSVVCQDRRDPIGVVVSIMPFNFPYMVPMWTIPIALVMGNAIIVKPSEKVPMTMHRVAGLLQEAGLPAGCFSLIQGRAATVQKLIGHDKVQAVTFVGSSPVAKIIADSVVRVKRCTALGGAKNHLVVLLDSADWDDAVHDIVVSFAGCAGQRCMAASVLLLIGDRADAFLDRVVAQAAQLPAGTGPGQMGPVIDQASFDKITVCIDRAESVEKAQLLLDGRTWQRKPGYWVGPTVLLHQNATDATMCEEVFGPVLSAYKCSTWQEAVDIENASPFGNAAAVYTTHGAAADWFCARFRSAMLGVNIGIPVPREPFSFGGLYGTRSKYGTMDITGDGAVEFFSNRIKISTKWPLPSAIGAANTTTTTVAATMTTDKANFAGAM
jgi:malonate-semialdehyde dehydrogenase (acetylating) / methylmalonate-semialdehyde dehydrogenase